MRRNMIENDSARIFIGGKKSDFHGIYPGLLEEFNICLELNKPIFLIGAFGGITHEIIQIIRGNNSQYLSEDYYLESLKYKSLFDLYSQKTNLQKIDYLNIKKKVQKIGISLLKNGLDENENLRLFETRYFFEMVFLIIKGLRNLNII